MTDRRTLTLGLVTVLIASMFAGAGSFAYFSDTEISTGNVFAAGTLDLKIRDWANGEPWFDGVTKTWTLSNMKPGHWVSGSVAFKNVGSIASNHLEIACDYAITDPEGPESDTQESTPADHLADYMIITEMTYYHNGVPINCLTSLTDNDADGIDLLELKQQGIDDLPPPDGAGDERIDMTIKFSEGAGNDFQGDTFVLTMIFTLNQHSNQ